MHRRASQLIAALDLRPHPEGGLYREIYRSSAMVLPGDGRGRRAALTSIFFLLPAGHHSRWHRVMSDEVWHLYEGGPLELLELSTLRRDLVRYRLAHASDDEPSPVCTIAAGNWQAARPLGDYALVGCTVAPGFDFSDFMLLADDPEASATIRAMGPDVAELI